MLRSHDPLLTFIDRLSGAESSEEVILTTLAMAPAVSGAGGVLLALANESGAYLDLRKPDAIGPRETVALSEDLPIVAAVVHGPCAVEVSDTPEIVERLGLSEQTRAVIALPLLGIEGLAGSIMFAYSQALEALDDDVRRSADAVARLVGRELEDKRLHHRTRQLVSTLKDVLLTVRNPIPELEVTGKYLPPWTGIPLGGDWFDAFALEDGKAAMVIGDVAGHGIEVSPTMLELRSYARAIMSRESIPVRVLAELDTLISRFAPLGGLATIAVAVFDPGTRTLDFVNAGLPPALLRRSDGSITLVESGRARLVGTDLQRQLGPGASLHLDVGDTILFITDGVLLPILEAGTDIYALSDTFEVVGDGPLVTLVDAVLPESAELRVDDATVLAMRVRG